VSAMHLTRAALDALGPAGILDALATRPIVVWGQEAPPQELDLRGEVCPFTFVRTKLRLEELRPGERLRVLVDHEPASRNIPRSAREWGQTIVHVGPLEAGVWQILIERTAG
jgi:tRNA 2-thiouridine synthesizing protein A